MITELPQHQPENAARPASAGERSLIAGLSVLPLVYFVLMVVGLVRWYTPVPFWDMWDAYLAGYLEYLNGDWRALFAQTNEHRIWFSDVLFFLDLKFFGGASRLLIPANALLAAALWGVLSLIAQHVFADRRDLWIVVTLILGPLCFSWLQEQNLAWGFQSQFFAAYLFPLAAFACQAMSFTSSRSLAWFLAAIAFGMISLGTMANGVLALPLLAVMIAAAPRPSWRRAAVVVVVAAIAITAWFQGYFEVERERASLAQAATFVLTFLGFPFDAILGLRSTYAAGIFFVLSTAAFAARWIKRRAVEDPMVLALLTFLAYIGATCAVIALGRAAIEPNATLVSRYATPSLLAWAALAILFTHAFREKRRVRAIAAVVGVAAALGLFPAQRRVFDDAGPEYVHQKWIGALALKAGVRDLKSIGNIYPTGTKDSAEHVLLVAGMAEKHGLSIMANPFLVRVAAALGKPVGEGFYPCAGVVEHTDTIDTDPSWVRASGWAFDDRANKTPRFAYISSGQTIDGFFVTGLSRRDVAAALQTRAIYAGSAGFLRAASAASADLKIYCRE